MHLCPRNLDFLSVMKWTNDARKNNRKNCKILITVFKVVVIFIIIYIIYPTSLISENKNLFFFFELTYTLASGNVSIECIMHYNLDLQGMCSSHNKGCHYSNNKISKMFLANERFLGFPRFTRIKIS